MDLIEGDDQVQLTMTPAEWAQLRRSYQAAWFFIRDAVKNSIPEGRTFGRGLVPGIYRVHRFETQAEFEASQDNDRIKVLEQRLEALGRLVGDSIASLSEQGNIDRDRVNGAWSAIADLRSKFEHHDHGVDPTGAEAQDAIERRLASIEDELAGILAEKRSKAEYFAQLYGSPTGRLDPAALSKIMSNRSITVLPPGHETTFGLTFDEIERRVRDYMTGHFSEATIGGVVEAIRRPTIPEPKLNREPLRPEIRYVTDHHFRFKAPDRRHCSFLVNAPQAEKCGLTAERHLLDREDFEGVNPPGHFRPIKDNPQA